MIGLEFEFSARRREHLEGLRADFSKTCDNLITLLVSEKKCASSKLESVFTSSKGNLADDVFFKAMGNYEKLISEHVKIIQHLSDLYRQLLSSSWECVGAKLEDRPQVSNVEGASYSAALTKPDPTSIVTSNANVEGASYSAALTKPDPTSIVTSNVTKENASVSKGSPTLVKDEPCSNIPLQENGTQSPDCHNRSYSSISSEATFEEIVNVDIGGECPQPDNMAEYSHWSTNSAGIASDNDELPIDSSPSMFSCHSDRSAETFSYAQIQYIPKKISLPESRYEREALYARPCIAAKKNIRLNISSSPRKELSRPNSLHVENGRPMHIQNGHADVADEMPSTLQHMTAPTVNNDESKYNEKEIGNLNGSSSQRKELAKKNSRPMQAQDGHAAKASEALPPLSNTAAPTIDNDWSNFSGKEIGKIFYTDIPAQPPIPINRFTSVKTEVISSLNELYMSTTSFRLQRDNFQDELNRRVLRFSQVPSSKPEVGEILVGCYSVDELWYRVKVIKDLDDGRYEVLYCDFGNTDIIAPEKMRRLPSFFLKSVPFFVVHCVIAGVKPNYVVDSYSGFDELKDFFHSQELRIRVLYVLDTTEIQHLAVELYGKDDMIVSNHLIERGYCEPSDSIDIDSEIGYGPVGERSGE